MYLFCLSCFCAEYVRGQGERIYHLSRRPVGFHLTNNRKDVAFRHNANSSGCVNMCFYLSCYIPCHMALEIMSVHSLKFRVQSIISDLAISPRHEAT